jgi:hypothetical protein
MAGTRGTSSCEWDDIDIIPVSATRTKVSSGEDDWLVTDIVSGWDVVFGDISTNTTKPGDSASRFSTFIIGDRPTNFLWRGCRQIALSLLSASTPITLNWDFLVSERLGAAPSRWPSSGSQGSRTADVLDAVEWMTRSLGVAERDVLAASGIRGRTYYNWKQNPDTSPRTASQANLWNVVGSVAAIVDVLDNAAPSWFHADPGRLDSFRRGQHARLALLAAAANADVRIPSETLDAAGVEPSADADRLKRFRTHHAVRYTHDEDGSPIAQTTGLAATFYADAPEDELIIDDDDE